MSELKTQSSSKPRLANDTLGNDALQALYKAYETMPLEDFHIFAEGVVMAGGGKQPMKLAICESMVGATKEKILTKAQNFILAGMGLGV
jgi:hypothetical protein